MSMLARIFRSLADRLRRLHPGDHYGQPLPYYAIDSFLYLKSLFQTLAAVRADPAAGGDLAALIRETETRPPTWGDLFRLDVGILGLQTREELAMRAPAIRAKFRSVVGDADFAAIARSPAPETDEAALRAELVFLVREIHSRYAMTAAREASRNVLMLHIIRFSLLYLVLMSGLFWLAHLYIRDVFGVRPTNPYYENMVTAYIAAVMGCVGGYVSIQSRLQSLPYEGDPLFRMIALNEGWLSIYLAPISGSILALIAYLLFAAQLVKGDLFPEFAQLDVADETGNLANVFTKIRLKQVYDYPKLFIWSFLVGFAERFVPDALTRIIQRRKDGIVAALTPAPPVAPPVPAPPPN
jgi:hypothetical protein